MTTNILFSAETETFVKKNEQYALADGSKISKRSSLHSHPDEYDTIYAERDQAYETFDALIDWIHNQPNVGQAVSLVHTIFSSRMIKLSERGSIDNDFSMRFLSTHNPLITLYKDIALYAQLARDMVIYRKALRDFPEHFAQKNRVDSLRYIDNFIEKDNVPLELLDSSLTRLKILNRELSMTLSDIKGYFGSQLSRVSTIPTSRAE